MRNVFARILFLVAFSAFIAATQSANAETMKILVPYAAGGTTDILARVLALFLQRKSDQTVLVENRVGDEGRLAAETLKGSPADGNTFLIVTSSMFVPKSYDTISKFEPCCLVTTEEMFLVVAAGSPVKSLKDLIARKPANYATTLSPGSIYAGSELARATGIAAQAVSFKG